MRGCATTFDESACRKARSRHLAKVADAVDAVTRLRLRLGKAGACFGGHVDVQGVSWHTSLTVMELHSRGMT